MIQIAGRPLAGDEGFMINKVAMYSLHCYDYSQSVELSIAQSSSDSHFSFLIVFLQLLWRPWAMLVVLVVRDLC